MFDLNTILNFIVPFLTLVLGVWGKGYYEKRKAKVDSHSYEFKNYSDMYEKMRQEMLKLQNQILEYQNEVLKLRTQLAETNAKLQEVMYDNRLLRLKLGEDVDLDDDE